MSRHAATDPMPLAGDTPRFDWREWLAFAGCALGTALFVSIVLGAVVLIISTQANAQPVGAPPALSSPVAADRGA